MPQHVIDKVLSGRYLVMVVDDTMAKYNHIFHLLNEEVKSGPAGYYFRSNLPLTGEIVKVLSYFQEGGILQRVSTF